MIDLSPIPAVAKDIIIQVGNSAVLRTVTNLPYDTTTSTGGSTVVDTNVKVVFEKFNSEQIGGDVLSGDVEFMIVTDTAPLSSDKIIFQGDTYNIVNIQPTVAQDLIFYYLVHSRV